MGRKKAHAQSHGSSERWLLTYADLITLLLIYFIVLFASSQIDINKYHKIADSLSNAFNVIPSQGGAADSVLPPASSLVMPPVAPMYGEQETSDKAIERAVKKIVADSGASKSLDVHEQKRGLVISIADSAMFAPGSSQINPEMMKTLNKVSALLADVNNTVRVEGHTDDRPIRTAQFPSNWELSTSRATNVVRYLIERNNLPPGRLAASGYGEHYPRVPNLSEAHRAKNRRVDIVILREGAAAQEPPKPAVMVPAQPSEQAHPIGDTPGEPHGR